jgi:hypothetical protein
MPSCRTTRFFQQNFEFAVNSFEGFTLPDDLHSTMTKTWQTRRTVVRSKSSPINWRQGFHICPKALFQTGYTQTDQDGLWMYTRLEKGEHLLWYHAEESNMKDSTYAQIVHCSLQSPTLKETESQPTPKTANAYLCVHVKSSKSVCAALESESQFQSQPEQ